MVIDFPQHPFPGSFIKRERGEREGERKEGKEEERKEGRKEGKSYYLQLRFKLHHPSRAKPLLK